MKFQIPKIAKSVSKYSCLSNEHFHVKAVLKIRRARSVHTPVRPSSSNLRAHLSSFCHIVLVVAVNKEKTNTIMSEVPPTRMNQQIFKGKKKAAQSGHKLLKKKADALKVSFSFCFFGECL